MAENKERRLTDSEADFLYQQLADGLVLLRDEAEIDGEHASNHARILLYALAGFLEERGIIEQLRMCADYMAAHGGDTIER